MPAESSGHIEIFVISTCKILTIRDRRDGWVHFHIAYYKDALGLQIVKRMTNGVHVNFVSHAHMLMACLLWIIPLPPSQMSPEKHKLDASRNWLDSVFQEVHEPRHPKRHWSMRDDNRGMESLVSKCVDQSDKTELWDEWPPLLPESRSWFRFLGFYPTAYRHSKKIQSLSLLIGIYKWQTAMDSCSCCLFTQLENGPYLIHLWSMA